jgi:hypothetical protein
VSKKDNEKKKDNPTATIYVGKPGSAERIKWDKFLDNCTIRNWNYSRKVRELCDAENQRLASLNGVEVKPIVDFEGLKAKRLQLKKVEDHLWKRLQVKLPNRRTAYETLCDFAGTDQRLKKRLLNVYDKMKTYTCNDSDPFNATDVENFVEYIEAVLERREIEAQLRDHRNRNNSNA